MDRVGRATISPSSTLISRLCVILAKSQSVRIPQVNAYKGNIGHTLGAAGAIETVLTLLSILAGKSPPIAGLEENDCEIQTAKDSPIRIHGDTAITVSIGMGGCNVAIALRAH